MTELERLINLVVDARRVVGKATELKDSEYQEWVEENQPYIDAEIKAKSYCLEAETQLREMALQTYEETEDKQVAPGVGIRVRTVLNYESKDAMDWAVKHELALKLDSLAFEKIAKTSNLSFVTITEEPTTTISQDLKEIS